VSDSAPAILTVALSAAVGVLGWFLKRESIRVDHLEARQHDMQLELAKNSEQNRQLFMQVSQMRDDLRAIAEKLDRLIERG
jgi:cell division protein FtsB